MNSTFKKLKSEMEKHEIQLVNVIIERVLLIQDLLKEVTKTEYKNVSSIEAKEFIAPHIIDLQDKHWHDFEVLSRKQIYGLNQNIIKMKRARSSNALDVELLRLMARASLDGSNLLKGLLKFPAKLQKRLGGPADVAGKIISTNICLISILQQMGFSAAIKNSPYEGNAGVSTTESLGEEVDSSVMEELQERGSAFKHLARLAKQRLGNAKRNVRPAVKSFLLPRDRRMYLLEDSLSHLLAPPKKRPAPRRRHRSRGTRTRRAPRQHLGDETRGRHLGDETRGRHVGDETRGRHVGDETRGRHVGDETRGRHVGDETRGRHVGDETRGRHVWDETRGRHLGDETRGRHVWDETRGRHVGDETQRQQLWQQLLPLIINQESLILGAEGDLDCAQTLRQLDDISERLDDLILRSDYNASLVAECRRLDTTEENDDFDLEATIQKAKQILRKITNPSSENVELASKRNGNNASNALENHSEEEFSVDQQNEDERFTDSRKRREAFWASLAQEGYVGSGN
ncbi:uncharacterized protein LOC108667944 isoform X2 [Hyalella azteca]|uniref:Uncharacterized protein LOC108667944 isoform X2 n=1 Tax=Hyalella azteca TaxID=294128 RepID=A0A979FVL4_HYAAZ|nr:uncharacterized protein LOC108667944 isoform X2 [Hyalella azteca]